jgi:catechol 2,3-dioxygenase-like lactoylglutathione lyase family enzyme
MIQHVALETTRADGPAAAAFWELLGFARVDAPPTLRDRAAWLERAGTQIHLLWADDPRPQPVGHVAVVVADYDRTLDRLRAAGYRVDPRAEHWGAPRSYVTAPGGHRIEMMAHPPRTVDEAVMRSSDRDSR